MAAEYKEKALDAKSKLDQSKIEYESNRFISAKQSIERAISSFIGDPTPKIDGLDKAKAIINRIKNQLDYKSLIARISKADEGKKGALQKELADKIALIIAQADKAYADFGSEIGAMECNVHALDTKLNTEMDYLKPQLKEIFTQFYKNENYQELLTLVWKKLLNISLRKGD